MASLLLNPEGPPSALWPPLVRKPARPRRSARSVLVTHFLSGVNKHRRAGAPTWTPPPRLVFNELLLLSPGPPASPPRRCLQHHGTHTSLLLLPPTAMLGVTPKWGDRKTFCLNPEIKKKSFKSESAGRQAAGILSPASGRMPSDPAPLLPCEVSCGEWWKDFWKPWRQTLNKTDLAMVHINALHETQLPPPLPSPQSWPIAIVTQDPVWRERHWGGALEGESKWKEAIFN